MRRPELSNSEFETEDDTVETYDNQTILTCRSLRLNNGYYAYINDEQLREYENNFGYFILDEDFYFTDGSRFYHKRDPNIPEDAYDSQEADRRLQEELQRMIAEGNARREAEARAQAESGYTFITSSSGTTGTFNLTPALTYLNSTGLSISIDGSSVSSSLELINETVQEEVELEPEEMEEDLQDEQQFLI